MNSFASKLLTMVACLLLLVYAVYQGYRYVYSPYTTELAVDYAYQSVVSAKGVALREEQVITARPDGIISYMQENSGKVSARSVIAKVFTSEADVITHAAIQQTQAQIDSLQEAQNPSSSTYANTETLVGQMYEEYAALLNAMAAGQMEQAQESRQRYLELLNRYRIKTGKEQSYQARIDALQQRQAELTASLSATPQNITAPVGGYFSESTDGLEETIQASRIDSYTLEELRALIDLPQVDGQALGKLVREFNWYFAAVIPNEQLERFLGVTTVTIDFHVPGAQPVPASIYRILQDRSGTESIVVFNCKELYGELINLRTQTVEIKLGTIRGVRVNSQAIRFVEGQAGVYLRNGFTVVFCPVRVLYEEPGFTICDPDFGEKPIKQYDEIIVEGDVYDGKTILG